MSIERAQVDHVVRLARLDLGEADRERMAGELNKVLEHAAVIQSLDLDGIEPTSHSVALRNVTRPDEVSPSLPPEVALANAPEAEEGRFRVPRIIEDAG